MSTNGMPENAQDSTNFNCSENGKSSSPDCDSNGSLEGSLTAELLYKMNKKIAQLTKVVYGLNTRGEELEFQLTTAVKSEEKTKELNNDLQQRVSTFKNKIEAEMNKLRDLETQASQSQFWKRECETLKRRLEVESTLPGGDSRLALMALREDIEQCMRRENALQYELDQARLAISNLKAHHDFIMRERDDQMNMEREKIVLEWQGRLGELETRYKLQLKRATDDMEIANEECDMLKRRIKTAQDGNGFRDQLNILEQDFTVEKRDWERKLRQCTLDLQQEKTKHNEEMRESERKLRNINEEKRKVEVEFERKFRLACEDYEKQLRDSRNAACLVQKLLDDKEEEFEHRLKAKVVEWKSEWELAEDELKEDLRKLKEENERLRMEANRSHSTDSASSDVESKLKCLEEEVDNRRNELEVKTKNFNVRTTMLENKNKQLLQEKSELERQLESESGRYKDMLRSHETLREEVKDELESRVQKLEESDKILRATNRELEKENERLRNEAEDLKRKVKEIERSATEKLDLEKLSIENRVRQKTERLWLEKLQQSEEQASRDLSKIEEASRRKEASLQREIDLLQRKADDARKLHEDLKKRLRDLRQKELETSKKASEYVVQIQDLKRKEEESTLKSKETEEVEKRYKNQIDRLNQSLRESQKEANRTSRELQMQKDELEKSKTNAAALQELQKNAELLRLAKEKDSIIAEHAARLKQLQDKLEKSESTVRNLQETLEEVDEERDEELKIVQDALDEAALEREDLLSKFKKELQDINTKNTAREQQMLDDFEWKLHEMEKQHKKKLQEKEKQAEEQLNAVRSVVESELSESLTQVAEDRRIADEKLATVINLKSYEAEAKQLRGVTHEFQKALRASAREMDNMKIKVNLYEEEIKSLKTRLQQPFQNSLQRNKRYSEDDNTKQKMEKMRNELNAEWEDKLRSQCSRLKSDLDELYIEEKHLAIESMKLLKDQEMQMLKSSHERAIEELKDKINELEGMQMTCKCSCEDSGVSERRISNVTEDSSNNEEEGVHQEISNELESTEEEEEMEDEEEGSEEEEEEDETEEEEGS